MTLRGRLTAAFLAVAFGPVLLGAVFVASTVTAVDRSRATERLAVAANAVRTSIDALCQQLRAAADAVALTADHANAATQVVSRGLAAAVLVTDVAGRVSYATPNAPPAPWRDCASPEPPGGAVGALVVRVELRDPAGAALGTVAAAQPVDPVLVARLAAVTGVAVTLLDGAAAPVQAAHTTESAGGRDAVLAAAAALRGEHVTGTPDGRYVRRAGPTAGQPLPLVLSVPSDQPPGLHAVLVAVVLLAALLGVTVAWRLARVTTRPLVELAGAVDRVAAGDLTARVPVRAGDEVGRLAVAFNRMTRETDSYLAALASSRDQLRGHLAVLGDTLASTHDLQRILRVILHSALAATGARAGAVLLTEPGGMLVAQCTEGLDGRRPGTGTLRIPAGSGVVGAVAATGQARRGRAGPAPAAPGDPLCRTYIAVPFAAPAGRGEPGSTRPADSDTPPGSPAGDPAEPALGVLALYDRLGGEEFDDDDLITLRTFAGHAAVAVDNVRVHEENQRLSLTDPLTGLWNYRYLRESLRREVERASRFGRMVSVLALDLDRFKKVNDTYGHAAGDTVLAEFARRVRGEIREVDLAFRQGGEEFVVLLPETDSRGATIVAERLGAAVRDTPVTVVGHAGVREPITVTVSIGIAVFPDHADTGPQVLQAADEALYAAKGAGRDTWRVAATREASTTREMPVPPAARTPSDELPRAGPGTAPGPSATPGGAAGAGRAGTGRTDPAGGASSGPHPPGRGPGR
ncbi:diguanylate cyclase [Micromonospora sp. WMMD1082]|uniref:diguanylate cyclase n=1 Tax=Micromonospora sp. WMMD1082 TaxID=3016104 RepID=UPI002417BDD8|nr:diguanylate cyclase [Micromonospora sp. WMMD1082]MDG4793540.1 diguanylate cyclase [Micromonospora sp. WMMD1082]